MAGCIWCGGCGVVRTLLSGSLLLYGWRAGRAGWEAVTGVTLRGRACLLPADVLVGRSLCVGLVVLFCVLC